MYDTYSNVVYSISNHKGLSVQLTHLTCNKQLLDLNLCFVHVCSVLFFVLLLLLSILWDRSDFLQIGENVSKRKKNCGCDKAILILQVTSRIKYRRCIVMFFILILRQKREEMTNYDKKFTFLDGIYKVLLSVKQL